MNDGNGNDEICRQCKMKITHMYEGPEESHVQQLRKCDADQSSVSADFVCDISALFSVTDAKKKKTGREENRPRRAKAREMPSFTLTYQHIREAQEKDDGIGPVLKLFEKHGKDNKPDYQQISHLNSECKFWHARWELLQIQNSVLCIRWVEETEERLRICTPRQMRDDVMWYLHDAPTSGHMGIQRTIQRAKNSSYYWPGMNQYVRDYVKSCYVCEERKNPARKKRTYMKSYITGGRFERVAADIAGPFPKTANENVYILVISDYFTKFSEIYPIPNMEAKTIASVFFRGWIKRYGCPREFHSDQGTQFESQVFQHLCSMFGILKTRTTAFHPRSDGMVERLNRSIKEMLSKYINVRQTNWDDYIDCMEMAYNSSVHETTGVTPYRMVFGSEMTVPLDLQTEAVETDKEEMTSAPRYVRELCENLDIVHRIARECTSKAVLRQKKHYDKSAVSKSYDVGDVVRRFQPKQIIGTKLKLARNWSGPWVITRRLSDVLFEIKHSKNSKAVIVHADNLKSFHVRKTAKANLQKMLKTTETPTKPVKAPELDPRQISDDVNKVQTPRKPNTLTDQKGGHSGGHIAARPGDPNLPSLSQQKRRLLKDAEIPNQSRDKSPPSQVTVSKTTRRGRMVKLPKRFQLDHLCNYDQRGNTM